MKYRMRFLCWRWASLRVQLPRTIWFICCRCSRICMLIQNRRAPEATATATSVCIHETRIELVSQHSAPSMHDSMEIAWLFILVRCMRQINNHEYVMNTYHCWFLPQYGGRVLFADNFSILTIVNYQQFENNFSVFGILNGSVLCVWKSSCNWCILEMKNTKHSHSHTNIPFFLSSLRLHLLIFFIFR